MHVPEPLHSVHGSGFTGGGSSALTGGVAASFPRPLHFWQFPVQLHALQATTIAPVRGDAARRVGTADIGEVGKSRPRPRHKFTRRGAAA